MAGPASEVPPLVKVLKRKRVPDDDVQEEPTFSVTKNDIVEPSNASSAAGHTDRHENKTNGNTTDRNPRAKETDSETPASVPIGSGGNNTSTKKRGRSTPRSDSSKGSKRRTPSAPWPDTFKQLSQVHRALNLVYTFCCTRKHFATTFNNVKNAVQAQLGGRELTVEDVAMVKILVPWAVRFEYVDEESLEVMTATSTCDKEKREIREYGLDRRKMWDPTDRDIALGKDFENYEREKRMDTLLFEFVDADLKKQTKGRVKAEPGKPAPSGRATRGEDLKMPVFGHRQMLALIEKRNSKFADAIDSFLIKCEDNRSDPVEALKRERDALLTSLSGTGMNKSADPSMLPAEIPKERKSMAGIVSEMRSMEWYSGQIVPNGHRAFDAQPAVYGDLNFQLSQNLVNALYNAKNITQLYSHQAEAINHLYEGHNVIVSTSTSSGKSLIYQIPVLHELERDPDSRGMYIFPTKALAQDQRRSMKDLLRYMDDRLQNIIVETFDGDTPMADRNVIRDEARIIFTNPDMLHISILPNENSWHTFLKNLKFVVVDELHVYNGLFGSHVALIMRRLRRICAAVGNRHVKFISCSATIANPEEHMKTIFGVDDVKLVDFDGSPSGHKEFICWNTPFKDPNDPSSGRGDTVAETARIFCQLVLRGARVIAFARIRKLCEALLQAVRNEFQVLERPGTAKLVMGYRGGYSPQDRRKIEKEMFEGKLLGIVATNALELGVDIGSLDAVVTMGFPYSISNLRQQSGRAGRRNKDSLSVLVGSGFPTDQYYMKNPDELFTRPNCGVQVDLSNELILEGHIQCAAFEMPIRPEEDTVYFGEKLSEIAPMRLFKDDLGFYHCHERFRPHPSRCVTIRDTEDQHFAIIDTTNDRNLVLEEIEASRALFSVYEGGIYMHQGQPYLVTELNPDRRLAHIVRVNVDWSTMQRDFTDIDPIETESQRLINSTSLCRAFYGSIQIHSAVYGFFKVDKRGRILDAVAVDNPPIDILTKGMWLDVPSKALEILRSRHLNIAAAIHAAEHAVLSLLPSFVISTPGDVRTECKVAKKELGRELRLANSHNNNNVYMRGPEIDNNSLKKILQPPHRRRPARLTFYDAKGGSCGSGIAAKAFEFVDMLLCRAVSRIEGCECVVPQGCVECVCDERCKEMNIVMSKAGAGVVLRCLLGWEVDVDSLPWGQDCEGNEGGGELAGGLETIVPASEIPSKKGRAALLSAHCD
ncbi:hypothetical protein MPDQ_001565 [Monascus purpureus]|uniref:DEAD/DEAH box helicase n=1 Tax=Monascus purpureus TaxID=5098 RepID=A0A507QMC6_MONPU|nr:hypothetical protein MPDQ_001565 [Monascus purpureus]